MHNIHYIKCPLCLPDESAKNSHPALIWRSDSADTIPLMSIKSFTVSIIALIVFCLIPARTFAQSPSPRILLPLVGKDTQSQITHKLGALRAAWMAVKGQDVVFTSRSDFGIVGVWLDDLNRANTPDNNCLFGIDRQARWATYCIIPAENDNRNQIPAVSRYGAQYPGSSQVQYLFQEAGLILFEDGSFDAVTYRPLRGQIWTSGDKSLTVYTLDVIPTPDGWQVELLGESVSRPMWVKAEIVAGSWIGRCELDNDNTIGLYHNGNGQFADGSSLPEFVNGSICQKLGIVHQEATYADAGKVR